jgi:hypothetical protein
MRIAGRGCLGGTAEQEQCGENRGNDCKNTLLGESSFNPPVCVGGNSHISYPLQETKMSRQLMADNGAVYLIRNSSSIAATPSFGETADE